MANSLSLVDGFAGDLCRDEEQNSEWKRRLDIL
jgi:hypothetical protein